MQNELGLLETIMTPAAGLVSLPQTMACYMQLAAQLIEHQHSLSMMLHGVLKH
jgi:hypothetical protein